MNREEWLRRYKQAFIDAAGVSRKFADDCAGAEAFEILSDGYEDDPEGAAGEEMSCWEQ